MSPEDYYNFVKGQKRAASAQGGSMKVIAIGGSVIGLLVLLFLGGSLVEGVDASEIVLIQSLSGQMKWETTPGWAWQGFGKVTRYPKRGIIRFQPSSGDGDPDERLPLVFNDAGRGVVTGSINYELPLDVENLTELHSAYPDAQSLEHGLVRPALNKSVFLTGTLMTSYESYKEKRSSLIQYVEDQTQNGVYQTKTIEKEVDEETLGTDGQPITVKKRIAAVEIVESNGQRQRNESGQLARFGVKAFNFAIEDLDYDAAVDKQIQDQQAITMSVQTSIANAKKAIQDAVTADAQGRANVATTRAAAEIEKTKAVVEGEKARDVAQLAMQQAKFYKDEQILRAEADSEYRRKIMSADNALSQRLEAYKFGVERLASAIEKHQGNWVPAVVIGGGTGNNNANSSVQALMDLLLVNQAKALGLNLVPSHKEGN